MKKTIGAILLILVLGGSVLLYFAGIRYQAGLAHEPMTAGELNTEPKEEESQNQSLDEKEEESAEEPQEETDREEELTETTENVPESREEALSALENSLSEKISSYRGTWAAYIKYLPTGEDIKIGSKQMVAASLIKLFIAGAYLEAVENNEIQGTYDTQLFYMLSQSDNASANQLIDLLGIEKINSFIQNHGFEDSILNRKMLEKNGLENYTSVYDCGLMMEQVYRGTYVSEDASQTILEALKAQKVTAKIPAGLPEGVESANKTGELPGTENDAAIVFSQGGDYVFCVMSNGVSSGNAHADIREMSAMIYDALQE